MRTTARRWTTLLMVAPMALLMNIGQASLADTSGGISITIPPLPTASPTIPVATPSADAMEAELLAKVNAERAGAGLGPLQTHPWAQAIARTHSTEMAAARGIWHNHAGYLDIARTSIGAYLVGENVGEAGTLDGVHQALMASASHRLNILYPTFNYVGIGVAVDFAGYVYVTQDFLDMRPATARPRPAPSPMPAKKAVATVAAPPTPAAPRPTPSPPPTPAPTPGSAPAASMTLEAVDPLRSIPPAPGPLPATTRAPAATSPPLAAGEIVPAGSHRRLPTAALWALLGTITAAAAVGVPVLRIRRRSR